MSAIGKTVATAAGGLTLDQLQAETVSDSELSVALSGVYQALASAGAVLGELRVFNATQAPEKWTEVDRSTPVPLQFAGANRSIMCGWRALTNTLNTTAVCVAGEHRGSVYCLYGIQAGPGYTTAYLERMDIATGKTYAVATHPVSSYSNAPGFYTPSAVIVGDYLYAYGGKDYSGTPYTTTYRINLLNPGAGWTALQNMPVGAFSLSSPVVAGTKIYVFGGISSGGYLNSVRVFDTVALAWSTLAATVPYGACEHIQTANTVDGNIVCVGGWTGSAEVKKHAVFNTATNSFGPAYDLPASWADRPRHLFKLAGQHVRGVCNTGSSINIVEWNGSTWSDTGIAAVAYGLSIGRMELSDGCSFMPASNCFWTMPHLKHAHAAASNSRLLCTYTG